MLVSHDKFCLGLIHSYPVIDQIKLNSKKPSVCSKKVLQSKTDKSAKKDVENPSGFSWTVFCSRRKTFGWHCELAQRGREPGEHLTVEKWMLASFGCSMNSILQTVFFTFAVTTSCWLIMVLDWHFCFYLSSSSSSWSD